MMKAKVLQFPRRNKIMKKKLDEQEDEQALALMLKHSKLIESRRKRGYSAEAIAKAVREAEDRKR